MRERERERERVINLWQVLTLAFILAIFSSLSFSSVTAFADEGENSSSAELQDSDFVHIKGGTSFYDAATLPVNKTNSFTVVDRESFGNVSYYYKFTLSSDGYISIPSTMTDGNYNASDITIYNNAQEKIWVPGSSQYQNRKLGLPKGTYYLSFMHYDLDAPSTFQMRLNYTSSNVFEKEANDSFETANSVSLNKVFYGNGINSSKDYFKFSVPNKMNVRVAIKNTKSIGVQIHRSDLSLVGQWNTYDSQSGLTVDDKAIFQLSKGTYYISIGNTSYSTQNWEQEYSFKIYGTSVSNVTMHRLYNKWTGEHFYTSDITEKNDLVKKGWSYEGVGWAAPSTSKTPVYRLYNKYVAGGDHHYTTSTDERDQLKKAGWTYEGVGWYSDDSKGVALYRQYNPYATTGTHNYTTAKSENDNLVSKGWRAEGVSWYGVK